jgi:acetylornithine/N-succinyldiaminopimelate aminotransferase
MKEEKMTQHLLDVYNRSPIDLDRGEGSWLIAKDGTRYLDCVAGIATCSLGHAHPELIEALSQQAQKLWHVSNLFRVEGQDILAEKLTRHSFADRVFFANSGTEAIECALKMARKYHAARDDTQRIDIVGLSGSFHGRTYAAVNASGNKTYIDGFGPALPGYLQMDPDNLDALEKVITRPTTAAVIVEPVQGEGGARALSGDWLKYVRRACTDAGVLLIYDEVQCGMGRTGQLFAHQWFADAEPDIMAIAKALGGGFPVGACLASEAASTAMVFGTHGSTFGGNPLAMAVANRAFNLLSASDSLAHVEARSQQFFAGLQDAARRYPDLIVDVRGKGLLIGVKLVPNNREFMALARDQHLLVAGGGDNCIRFVPALNISAAEVEEAVNRFAATCEGLSSRMKAAA